MIAFVFFAIGLLAVGFFFVWRFWDMTEDSAERRRLWRFARIIISASYALLIISAFTICAPD